MEHELARRAIVDVCRRLYERGLIAGPDGNVSVRLPDGNVLVTPSGLSKGEVRAEELALLAPDGAHRTGPLPASSEVRMHLRIYARRPDAMAVVHAHPPTATGFALAGEDLLSPVLPEIILQMGGGGVPLLPYATPGTDALADSFEPFVARYDAFLLSHHGATTLGPSLRVAHQRMESLEHAARILLNARLVSGAAGTGRVRTLSDEQVRALAAIRDAARQAGRTASGESGAGVGREPA